MRRKKIIIVTAAILFSLFSVSALFALTGREIMDKGDALKDPDTARSAVIMTIKKGSVTMEKEFRLYAKKVRGDERVLISFTRPTRIKLLTHTYENKDDDQWLRLSSGRVKRIASSDKDKSFVNSHFWYEDLTSRELNDYNYKYIGDKKVAGFDCYMVEAKRKRGTRIYSKSVIYARKSDCFVVRVDFYRRGRFIKFLENYNIRKVSGIITPFRSIMKLANGNGQTELRVRGVQYNRSLSDAKFLKESLR